MFFSWLKETTKACSGTNWYRVVQFACMQTACRLHVAGFGNQSQTYRVLSSIALSSEITVPDTRMLQGHTGEYGHDRTGEHSAAAFSFES